MSLNVISNYAANVAHRYLGASDMAATSSLSKLSSGQRIVSAKDDAAGLAIGSRLALQVTALQQASTNATQATSMLQVADGALSKVGDILGRMKTLAVQAQSGQLGSTERSMIQTEYAGLLSEIDRISNDTSFNGVTLLAGTTAVSTSLNTQGTTGGVDYINAAHGFDSIAFGSSRSRACLEGFAEIDDPLWRAFRDEQSFRSRCVFALDNNGKATPVEIKRNLVALAVAIRIMAFGA